MQGHNASIRPVSIEVVPTRLDDDVFEVCDAGQATHISVYKRHDVGGGCTEVIPMQDYKGTGALAIASAKLCAFMLSVDNHVPCANPFGL